MIKKGNCCSKIFFTINSNYSYNYYSLLLLWSEITETMMAQVNTPIYLEETAKHPILGNYICHCLQDSRFHGKLLSDNSFEDFYQTTTNAPRILGAHRGGGYSFKKAGILYVFKKPVIEEGKMLWSSHNLFTWLK